MNIKNINITVGFSGNPEILVEYDGKNRLQKVPAQRIDCVLGGGSINVAFAIQQLTEDILRPKLFLATSTKDDVWSKILRILLKKNKLSYEFIKVREEGRTGIAIQLLNKIDVNQVIGDKGPMVLDRVAGRRAVKRIRDYMLKHDREVCFRIVTGARADEYLLIRELFNGPSDNRVLNPRLEFGSHNRQLLVELLSQVDLLIWNDIEFGAFVGHNVEDIQDDDFTFLNKFNIPLVVVTRNSHGTTLIWKGEKINLAKFDYHKGCVSEIGAGDWWLAAFLTYIIKNNNLSLRNMDRETAIKAAKYASAVAALKVSHPNGSLDGPTAKEVRQEYVTAE